jgi:flagellar hook-associated protein 1
MTRIQSLLGLASQGMAASTAGVATSGDNITNANVPGYARRRVNLTTRARLNGVPGGVAFEGVRRAFAGGREQRLMIQKGLLSGAQQRSAALIELETVLAPGEGFSIGDRMSDFFGSLQALTVQPNDPTFRNEVLAAAHGVANGFNEASGSIVQQRQDLFEDAGYMVADLNEMLSELASLNRRIGANHDDGSGNELIDARDELVREASAMLDFKPLYNDDDTVTLIGAGQALVDGGEFQQLRVGLDTAGNLAFSAGSHVLQGLDGGKIGGLKQARDQDLVGVLSDLDSLAFDFATSLNGIHTPGFGLDGVSGRELYTDPAGNPLVAAGAAAAFTLNPVVAGDHEKLASVSNLGLLPGGNDVLLDMAELAHQGIVGGKTPSERFGEISARVGQLVKSSQNEIDFRTQTTTHAENLRDRTSGVSVDEEMVDLTKYQRAYEASVKVLQTANQMFEDLLRL